MCLDTNLCLLTSPKVCNPRSLWPSLNNPGKVAALRSDEAFWQKGTKSKHRFKIWEPRFRHNSPEVFGVWEVAIIIRQNWFTVFFTKLSQATAVTNQKSSRRSYYILCPVETQAHHHQFKGKILERESATAKSCQLGNWQFLAFKNSKTTIDKDSHKHSSLPTIPRGFCCIYERKRKTNIIWLNKSYFVSISRRPRLSDYKLIKSLEMMVTGPHYKQDFINTD